MVTESEGVGREPRNDSGKLIGKVKGTNRSGYVTIHQKKQLFANIIGNQFRRNEAGAVIGKDTMNAIRQKEQYCTQHGRDNGTSTKSCTHVYAKL